MLDQEYKIFKRMLVKDTALQKIPTLNLIPSIMHTQYYI